jgi:hypothetical protein
LLEELGARKEEFAVEFEDFVKLGGYVTTDDVLDAYPCGLELANLSDTLAEGRVSRATCWAA